MVYHIFHCKILFTFPFQTAYTQTDDVYRLLRKVFALPMLPADDIRPAFIKLLEKNNTQDQQLYNFFEYVQATWIDGTIWPIESRLCLVAPSAQTMLSRGGIPVSTAVQEKETLFSTCS